MAERKRGKKYREGAKSVDATKRYPAAEAIEILSKFPKAKFDETVNLAIKLNVDPRKAEQNLRGAIALPHGTGKSARVIAFCEGDLAEKAKAAGAIAAGGAELAKKVEEGWLEFDKAVAHPSQMRHVGKLGKVLGPKGLMPTPKAGTVTEDIVGAVREFAAGKLEFRTDAGGNVHMALGKRSFDNKKLTENFEHVMTHIRSLRPPAIKGNYIEKVSLAGTMTPGVLVAVEQLQS
jgi:large subunit ribosomal protein L1